MTRREETTAEGFVLTRHPAWRPQIKAAGTHEEIRFAAISAPAQRGVDRLSVNGTLSVDSTLEAVRPLTVLL